MNLKNLTQPFTLKNKVLKKKNPNISLQVPLFRGIDGKIINDVLGFYKEEKDATGKVQITPINNYLREFINSYNNTDGNSRILGKKTKQALASLRAYIIETITESKNSILENEINEFLKKANLKETDLLMVRSTGKYEDMKNLANPGGNDSFPCHANVQEIKKAVGKVVASYFSEKSLGQRLTLKKENPAAANITETYYPAVLLQKMIGEPISKPGEKPEITAKNIVSGVIYCTKEGTTIQTAPGHCELVVNSKGPIDTVYVDPLGIVHQEIRIKDFKLSPQEEKPKKAQK